MPAWTGWHRGQESVVGVTEAEQGEQNPLTPSCALAQSYLALDTVQASQQVQVIPVQVIPVQVRIAS